MHKTLVAWPLRQSLKILRRDPTLATGGVLVVAGFMAYDIAGAAQERVERLADSMDEDIAVSACWLWILRRMRVRFARWQSSACAALRSALASSPGRGYVDVHGGSTRHETIQGEAPMQRRPMTLPASRRVGVCWTSKQRRDNRTVIEHCSEYLDDARRDRQQPRHASPP